MWVSVYQIFFIVFAASIPLIALALARRHLWLFVQSVRARRYGLLWISVVAIVVIAALFAVVGAVWFGYAVAHSKKDFWGDLLLVLATGAPFYGAAYGLWRLAASLTRKIKQDVT